MKIEKDIPCPEELVAKKLFRWPFKDMEVGDSVLIPADIAQRGQAYSHVYGKTVDREFRTQKQPCGGVRVWRVK